MLDKQLETFRPPPVSLPGHRHGSRVLQTIGRLFPIALVLAVLPFCIQDQLAGKVLLAAGFFLVAYVLRGSIACLLFAITYLSLIGGLRRWVIPAFGYSSLDPLLAVFPLFAALYVLPKAFARQLPANTWIS